MTIIPSLYDLGRYFLIREDKTEISFYIKDVRIVKASHKLTADEVNHIKNKLIQTTYESKINSEA